MQGNNFNPELYSEYSQIVQLAHTVGGEKYDAFTEAHTDVFLRDEELDGEDLVQIIIGIIDPDDESDEKEAGAVVFTSKDIREGLELGRKLGNYFAIK